MSDTLSPIVVLVHGAWHGAWCWAALQAELERRGVPSLALDLPGHGASTQPLGDLYGDAAHVAAVLDRLDRPVVLVGHSYGGAVITEAAAGKANIAHLVYVTAFCLEAGEALLANELPREPTAISSAIVFAPDGATSTIAPEHAVAAFYACCPPDVARAAIARLDRHPVAAFTQPCRATPWRDVPSTYVLCERDEAIHHTTQAAMAARCATTVRLDTDHSPFASMVGATADVLCGALAAASALAVDAGTSPSAGPAR